jgi:hypothetical protein
MKWFGDRHRVRPFPEILAAYVDGELDAAGRARVEAWLAQHPEAAAELEAQREWSRRNRRLWLSSAGPQPSDASWSRLFTRLQHALATPPARPIVHRWYSRGRAAAVMATAAAVLLAVVLLRPTSPPDPSAGLPLEDAWAVATDDDIDIVGIQDADTGFLVVGRPPLTGPIVLVSMNDVAIEKAMEDTDGMKPQMPRPGASVPMIVAPLGH